MPSPLSRLLVFVWIALFGASGLAEVRLPFVFTHHMVLQREAPVPVWGKATPGERVSVSFAGQTKEATADGEGDWSVTLDPLAPGDPRELVVTGTATETPVAVRDVLVGDVWLCSGQSNMEWSLWNSRDGKLDLVAADRPDIRLLRVKQLASPEPLEDIDAAWTVCNPESAGWFSAVGYHFGTQLQESLGVPIGLVDNSWGGSACEAWVPATELSDQELYAPLLERWVAIEKEHDEPALRADYSKRLAEFYAARATAYAAGEKLPRGPWVDNPLFHQHRPSGLFNSRVAPLVPMAIKGVVWYQGETNAGRAYQYRDLFPRMIQSWRTAWGQGDFPFYWVQLADWKKEPAGEPGRADSGWAELRKAQTLTQDRLPNTGEAVIIDLGEANDIHPKNKRDVGLRLARLALGEDYGKRVKSRSARFESLAIEGGKATVTLSGVGEGGLRVFDGGSPSGFLLAGEDRVFYPATAKLVGEGKAKNGVELASDQVPAPVAVRYAWADNPVVNLFDSAWLPVTPFRTDDWPGVTAGAR